MTFPLRRLWFVPALPLVALFAGCFGRQETVQAVSQLGSTSDRAHAVATQLKASDAAKTETLGKLYDRLLDTLKSDAEHEIDARTAAFTRDVNARETDALRGMLDRRAEFLATFAARVNDFKKPLVQADETARAEVQTAHNETIAHPGDRDLQQKLSDSTRKYFAIHSALAELETQSALGAYDAVDTAVADFAQTVHAAADKARASAAEAATRTKSALATKRAAAAKLALPADTDAYDALIAYTAAVRKSADSFKNYLAANSLGRDSFVGELGRSIVDNLVPGTLRVLQGDTVKPADLAAAARTTGAELYGDLKASVQSGTTDLLSGLDASIGAAKQQTTATISNSASALLGKFLAKIPALSPASAAPPSKETSP